MKTKKPKRVVLGEGYLRTSIRYSGYKEIQAVSLTNKINYGEWLKLNSGEVWGKKIRLIAEILE